ncbi:linoleate 13S-lipoxygenase [Ranunculus cassubicifolius]
MFSPQVHQSDVGTRALFVLKNSPFYSHGKPSITIRPKTLSAKKAKQGVLRVNAVINPSRAVPSKDQFVEVTAIVSVKVVGGIFSNISLNRGLDDITDLLGRSLVLELVSSETRSSEGQRLEQYARRISQGVNEVKYEGRFKVPTDFGEIGAVIVENEHRSEMYINNIVIDKTSNGRVTISCESWIHSKYNNPNKRVFFTNKSYLPSQTPSGIKKLREQDLESLRGNGEGQRQVYDRIYDYDKYNDLGNPDNDSKLARPVLGGSDHPYPRRCRTGRSPTKKDRLSEARGTNFYTPRDETFSDVKQLTFSVRTLRQVLRALIPSLEKVLVDSELGFPYFTRIDSMFNEGILIPETEGIFKLLLPRIIKAFNDGREDILLFETPEMMDRDKFSWLKDGEFSRQTLAGMNPYSIQLVTEWPMTSKLDPKIYGPAESAITKEIIEREIKGIMTLEEAMAKKKLFVVDYHDILLPYVHKVREIEGTTLYGSRTLFFQCENSTLRPIAIELTRPPINGKPMWRHVYTPCWDANNEWLWRFAKAHVLAHDSAYHQLVVHFLNTHACMEPYIIAANRQLSAMHPIYRLLLPHFRYTLEINALARESLINAGGIIETSFSPRRYSMELSSVAYDKFWRFDMEALPADLIRRGMAVEDPTAEHGLKLTIKDYPFANDGLVLWDAIKSWVTDYVNRYYPDSTSIISDTELQVWWTEVRTKGHADKKDEPWWPVLNTAESLIQTLSTIIWTASGHHAAVNFGQYTYAGYFPNRPTIARTKMPNEDPIEQSFKNFLTRPEATLLECFPSQMQATRVMAVLDVLSNHSPDEEYIGDLLEPSWSDDPITKAAFERFSGKLKEMEGIIDARNADPKLRNRHGAGIVPYELLKPKSKPGVTGMGVPNSISI